MLHGDVIDLRARVDDLAAHGVGHAGGVQHLHHGDAQVGDAGVAGRRADEQVFGAGDVDGDVHADVLQEKEGAAEDLLLGEAERVFLLTGVLDDGVEGGIFLRQPGVGVGGAGDADQAPRGDAERAGEGAAPAHGALPEHVHVGPEILEGRGFPQPQRPQHPALRGQITFINFPDDVGAVLWMQSRVVRLEVPIAGLSTVAAGNTGVDVDGDVLRREPPVHGVYKGLQLRVQSHQVLPLTARALGPLLFTPLLPGRVLYRQFPC